ncbi:MAG TPA: tripartite tricarboxylate transporter substrate binding protein BugD, partial [Xanthobacteraceae bacterium]
MITKRLFLTGVAASGFALNAAHAQGYPNKLIRLILPYTAGSPNDVLARLVVPHLSPLLGQTVLVDNRPG